MPPRLLRDVVDPNAAMMTLLKNAKRMYVKSKRYSMTYVRTN